MVLQVGYLAIPTLLATAGCRDGTETSTPGLEATAHSQSVARIVVSPDSADILEGESLQFRARLYDARGQDISDVVPVAWRSADPLIAIVDTRGLVTGKSTGRTTVTASAGGVLGSGVVKVPVPPVIAFVSDRDGNKEIYRISFNGAGLKNLTAYSGSDDQPDWSPDGTKIAFVRVGVGIGHNIWVMNADGSNPMSLTTGLTTPNDDPEWSPDGKKIAFVRDFGDGSSGGLGKEIYVMNSDFGGSQTNLTNSKADDLRPRWSPSGAKIGFLHHDLPDPAQQNLFTMNANGTGVTQLTFGGLNEDHCWSPDGAKIALTSNVGGSGPPPLYVLPAAGGPMTKLTTNGAANYRCEWSWDGGRIVWLVSSTDFESIWVMKSDGTNQLQLNYGGQPSWSHFYDYIVHISGAPIAIIHPDGTGLKFLTNTQFPHLDRDPQWKP
jgi:Tol biopolymer transport system component